MSSWGDALTELASSLNIFGRLVEAVSNAYHTGAKIVDDQSKRSRTERLKTLIGAMSRLNAEKMFLADSIDDYLRKSRYGTDWSRLQIDLRETANRVSRMCDAVEVADRDIIDISSQELHTNLLVTLKNQKREYQKLAEGPEPKSEQDTNDAREIAQKLRALLDLVKAIENALDKKARSP